MPFFRLADQLYIAPQINREDAAEAAKLGITTVICNRPDQEEPGQPTFAEITARLSEAGITEVKHQPLTAPQITEADALSFADTLAASKGPVLAYCRTGTRCSLLWAISRVHQGFGVAETIAEVKQKTGLDLTPFEAKLQTAEQSR